MQKREFVLLRQGKEKMYGDLRTSHGRGNAPLILFCHGFKGFKDWGGWQYGMDAIADAGYNAVSMNFSCNGTGEDLRNFTALDAFARNTIGTELEDIAGLLDAVERGGDFPEFGGLPPVGLIGHSRGGGTAVLAAARDLRIRCLVTWAGIANFDNYLARRKEWHERGYLEFFNSRTQQTMRMDLDFLRDLAGHAPERDIIAAEERLDIPHLIIHGDADETVPVDHALMLKKSANELRSRLEVIPGADHTFGQKHPVDGNSPHFDAVLEKTIAWLRQHLPPV